MDKKNKAAAKKPVEAKKYNAVSELDVKQKGGHFTFKEGDNI